MRGQRTTPSPPQKRGCPFHSFAWLIFTEKLLCARPPCSVLGMQGQPDVESVLKDAGTCWGPALWPLPDAQACPPTPKCPTCSAWLNPHRVSRCTKHLAGLLRGCCLLSTSSMQSSAPRVSVYLSPEGLELRIFRPMSQMTKPMPKQVKSLARAHNTSK